MKNAAADRVLNAVQSEPAPEGENRYFARISQDPLGDAFDRKLTVHAGFQGEFLPADQQRAVLAQLLARPREGKTCVYVHVPFCETHCRYCGFFRQFYSQCERMRYTDALIREIDLWRKTAAVRHGPVHAVYIGGGTPTSLEANELCRILLHIKDALPLANDCEITVESRIHNFDRDKIEACLRGGANRISVGVQTFDTTLRRKMGRIEDRDAVCASLLRMRDYDQAAVIIDLIFGFPGQTTEMWRSDIETFLSLNLDGIDLYALNVFPSSPLGKAIAEGSMPPAASLAQQAHLFAAGVRSLKEARHRRLSMAHWGRTPRERNLYNHFMKGPAHCLAFGPGAGGSLHGYSYFVNSDYAQWLVALDKGEKPVAALVAPSPLMALDKAITEAFDLGRLQLSHISSFVNRNMKQVLAPLSDQWEKAGLVYVDGDWLELTLAGQFWHVNLAQLTLEFLHRILVEEKAS
jgi:oxygen-independent coproporphyrinogen-3 oxidase